MTLLYPHTDGVCVIESVAVLVILALLPLAVPIRIGVAGRLEDEYTEARGCVHILFGLLSAQVVYDGSLFWRLNIASIGVIRRTLGEKEQKEEDEKPEEALAEEDQEPKAVKSLRERLDEVLAYYGIVEGPALNLLGRILRSFWLCRLEAEGRFGAGSPDATGRTTGVLYAANGATHKRIKLNVDPDFGLSGFRGRFTVEIAFWLGYLLLVVLWVAVAIGWRFGVWYLQQRLMAFRKPKTQPA